MSVVRAPKRKTLYKIAINIRNYTDTSHSRNPYNVVHDDERERRGSVDITALEMKWEAALRPLRQLERDKQAADAARGAWREADDKT
jgi:hypothetical protein